MIALFPGQGSQHIGMVKELYDNFSIARDTFEESSDAIHKNLKRLCFDGPESDLMLTENTQPSLLTASITAFRVAANEFGFTPTVAAGHSLGEYSALVAIGCFHLATAARWVNERGKAMQTATPSGQGTMAAIIGLDDDQIEKLCLQSTDIARENRDLGENSNFTVEPIVQPANYNAPGQTVISGSLDGIQAAEALIKNGDFSNGKFIPLSVSAAFHSKLMAPAREKMQTVFADAKSDEMPRFFTCPYVPNRTARTSKEPGLVFDLLIEQIDRPVLWRQSISHLLQLGHTQGIEFGPGKVLQGLCKRIAKNDKHEFTVQTLGTLEDLKSIEALLKNRGNNG